MKKSRSRQVAPLFRHILVPTDLTGRTAKSLQAAALLSPRRASHITLLHVIETIDGLPFAELAPFYRRLESRARAAMAKLARAVGKEAVVQCTVLYGHRAERIVKFVTANRVDLVVLASHRVTSMARRDWGTISYRVGILAPCPVLLVK